ncbi:MAG: SURF1 family protein [Alphaproteobacteria bacterium]|nr:SURF1 family protein [Alphaproteobacteria bacterium]
MGFRRPSLWLSLIALAAFCVLVGLGGWQLQRLEAKRALMDRIAERIAAQPIGLPPALSLADPAAMLALDYRRVRITGTFHHDKELHWHRPSKDGQAGYRVITPLQRPDGGFVLVSRGWVPPDRLDPATRPDGQITGPVAVEGVARLPETGGWMAPQNDPDDNIWFVLDIDQMVGHLGLARAFPLYVEAGDAPNPGGLPIGGQTEIEIRNRHLEYVVTWWGLAGALVLVFIAYHRRPAATHEGEESST